jgi:protein-L-isoaspartate(D-aspartate) O-methyltransferase
MPEPDWVAARARMVARQIEGRGVRDPNVLQAMRRVERHLFVPAHLREDAYEDRALSIGQGQTISQPYMVAAMTVALGPVAGGRVLEVGTGSGYQAAILAELAAEVITIERRPELADAARARLAALGYANVTVVLGDGTLGHPPRAPYAGIVVTAGAPEVPASLREQLADRARLVVPVGPREQQSLLVIQREGESFTEIQSEACVFVPLIGCEGWGED